MFDARRATARARAAGPGDGGGAPATGAAAPLPADLLVGVRRVPQPDGTVGHVAVLLDGMAVGPLRASADPTAAARDFDAAARALFGAEAAAAGVLNFPQGP